MSRTRSRLLALAGSLALLGSGCAAQNLSRTVGKGNGEFHSSVGGPFFSILGPTVPVPHANVGGRVGVADWADVDANVNILGLAFGLLALDAAGVFQLYRKPGGLAFSTSTRLYLYGDLDDAPGVRAYPEVGLHLGGPIPKLRWLHLYGGTNVMVNFVPPIGKSPVYVTPFFGTEFLLPHKEPKPGRKAVQHGIALHLSYTNPGPEQPSVVDYWPGYGAFGLFLGYRVRIGGLDR